MTQIKMISSELPNYFRDLFVLLKKNNFYCNLKVT